MIDFDPTRHAKRVFSRNPPILSNFPMTVSSPVVVIVSSRDFFLEQILILRLPSLSQQKGPLDNEDVQYTRDIT